MPTEAVKNLAGESGVLAYTFNPSTKEAGTTKQNSIQSLILGEKRKYVNYSQVA
jgi:hypothetical protein